MYCTRCGKEIPEGMNTCSYCDRVYQNNQTSQATNQSAGNSIQQRINALNGAKNLFFVTVGLFILNIIMSTFDMVDVSLLFSERSDSFYGILDYMKSSLGVEEAGFYLPLFTICTIATVLSIVFMLIPILLDKKYKKTYLLLNIPAMIAVFALTCLMIYFFTDDSSYLGGIEIKANVYLYLIETVLSMISTIVFMKKIKSV